MIVFALDPSTGGPLAVQRALSSGRLGAPVAGSAFTAPRVALWAAFAFAFFAVTAPDCCITGHHAAGFGMEIFGSICRAAR
jgi:hypothetical protein